MEKVNIPSKLLICLNIKLNVRYSAHLLAAHASTVLKTPKNSLKPNKNDFSEFRKILQVPEKG